VLNSGELGAAQAMLVEMSVDAATTADARNRGPNTLSIGGPPFFIFRQASNASSSPHFSALRLRQGINPGCMGPKRGV
jgi:hypothetical protein